jgi:hypothetical protein
MIDINRMQRAAQSWNPSEPISPQFYLSIGADDDPSLGIRMHGMNM